MKNIMTKITQINERLDTLDSKLDAIRNLDSKLDEIKNLFLSSSGNRGCKIILKSHLLEFVLV